MNTPPIPANPEHESPQRVFTALIISFFLHILLGAAMLQMDFGPSKLIFASGADSDQAIPTRIFIEPEIAPTVNENTEPESPLATDANPLTSGAKIDPKAEQAALEASTRRLLEDIAALSRTLPTGDPVASAQAGVIQPDLKAHEVDSPQVPGVGPRIDTTRQMLALAQTSVSTPVFIASTQEHSSARDDRPIDPAASIDLTRISDVDALLSGKGGGSGVGNSGAGGTGRTDPAALATDILKNLGVPDNAGQPGQPLKVEAQSLQATPGLPAAGLPQLPDSVVKADIQHKLPPIHLDDDFDYTLSIFRKTQGKVLGVFGEDKVLDQDGYFEATITPKKSLSRLRTMPKDVVYVIDTSGSISDVWINHIKKGVESAFDALNPADRFNLILFKESVQVLDPAGLVEASPANIKKAAAFLTTAASGGNTDVNKALGRLVTRDFPADRVYQIILISDGVPTRGAISAQRIIDVITRENDQTAGIFCVAVGEKVNMKLLDLLAYRNKGRTVQAPTAYSSQAVIRTLASELRYPLIRDARPAVLGVNSDEVYPRGSLDIYYGQIFSIYGRIGTQGTITIRMAGKAGAQPMDFTFSLPVNKAKPAQQKLAQDWAFWKVHHLYSESLRLGDPPAIRRTIDQLIESYGLDRRY